MEFNKIKVSLNPEKNIIRRSKSNNNCDREIKYLRRPRTLEPIKEKENIIKLKIPKIDINKKNKININDYISKVSFNKNKNNYSKFIFAKKLPNTERFKSNSNFIISLFNKRLKLRPFSLTKKMNTLNKSINDSKSYIINDSLNLSKGTVNHPHEFHKKMMNDLQRKLSISFKSTIENEISYSNSLLDIQNNNDNPIINDSHKRSLSNNEIENTGKTDYEKYLETIIFEKKFLKNPKMMDKNIKNILLSEIKIAKNKVLPYKINLNKTNDSKENKIINYLDKINKLRWLNYVPPILNINPKSQGLGVIKDNKSMIQLLNHSLSLVNKDLEFKTDRYIY